MEDSLGALTFSGSIPEAITEAKKERKLLVVYVSGRDEESIRLDITIWADSHVAECITKYCILLHIIEGSADAVKFSAIYPQRLAPCITAVGYNGSLLWQNEGHIDPESLASSLEKAWLSSHIQETTAGFLTAVLLSKKDKQPQNKATSDPTSVSSKEEDSSTSGLSVHSEDHAESSKAELVGPSQTLPSAEGNGFLGPVTEIPQKQIDSKINDDAVSDPVIRAVGKQQVDSEIVNHDDPEVSGPSKRDNQCLAAEESTVSCNQPVISEGNMLAMSEDGKRGLDDETAITSGNKPSSPDIKEESASTDVLLNIRLPDGVNLQNKFLKTDALRLVKDFVDCNLMDFHGSYDLAIPYPRRLFKHQDLAQPLDNLGIINRQSLIVIPHSRDTHMKQKGLSSRETSAYDPNSDSSQGRIGGYFAYVKRVLSYANPFSYLGGGSSGPSISVQESGPEAAMDNYTVQRNTHQSASNINSSPAASTRHNSMRRRPTAASPGFGGNIHTLKHDDDTNDGRDTNTYWNGNSTQFGGNEDKG